MLFSFHYVPILYLLSSVYSATSTSLTAELHLSNYSSLPRGGQEDDQTQGDQQQDVSSTLLSIKGHSTEEGSDCVEDRLETIEVGRQCSRRCKKDVPCENARKQCLCDGLCGLSCIRPDLSCAELPKIENGDYYPKTARFNAKVVYRCDPGYYLFGSRERSCQGDEDWSGTPAECIKERKCHTNAH